ncbi:MAG: hypothetical protein WC657_09610 [Candidatus Paceibacterota bacterium]|jgi:hypothetical protein
MFDDSPINPWVTIVVSVLLVAWAYWWSVRWYRLHKLFSVNAQSDTALLDANTLLEKVNRESTSRCFSAERIRTIKYKNESINLLYGRTGALGGPEEWTESKQLFAIVAKGSQELFSSAPLIFTPAFENDDIAIYWVNINKIDLTSRCT